MTEELYLVHFGTKGQKWGVRRYQNPDGTYTESGLKRYFNSKKEERKFKKAEHESKKAEKLQTKIDNAKTAKQLWKYRNYLSDDELNKRTERIKNEQMLYEASGRKQFDATMKNIGKTVLTAAVIAGTAYAGKKYLDNHGEEILQKVGQNIQKGMQNAASSAVEQTGKAVTNAAEKVKTDAHNARVRAARSPQGRAYVNAVNKIIGKK